MIESPIEAVYLPLTADSHHPDAPLNFDEKTKLGAAPGDQDQDQDLLIVKPQPITSSYNNALIHLRSQCGRLSSWRGISAAIAHSMLVNNVATMAESIFGHREFSFIVASILGAQLSLAWTHIVISSPSPKYWFQRLSPIGVFGKVVAPTALLAVTELLTVGMPAVLFRAWGLQAVLDDPSIVRAMDCAGHRVLALKFVAVSVLGLFLAIGIMVPANVTLTRVQASLLSDAEETIVPFDRSFGGKVEPEAVGGKGVVGMLDAWKTFSGVSRLRLLNLYAQVFAAQTVIVMLGAVVVGAELFLIMGDDFQQFFAAAGWEQPL